MSVKAAKNADAIIEHLLGSDDPAVRYKARLLLSREDVSSPSMTALRSLIAESARARSLLSGRNADGRIDRNPYRKFQGPHWTLVCLARIAYPPGDPSLKPLIDQVYDWLLEKKHLEFPRSLSIPGQEDRFRHCASMEGNAIIYSIILGHDDGRTREFVSRLISWQWPDGGWNCDKRPDARNSSVIESLIPLRALALASRHYGDANAARAAKKAADYFLERGLFRGKRSGETIVPSYGPDFMRIQFPISFWDILTALEAMAESGNIKDKRCAQALNILEAKRLGDGGFPAEMRTAKTSDSLISRGTFANWGNFGLRRMNELVTVEALGTLRQAGRL